MNLSAMDDASFRNQLEPWMASGAHQLIFTIPSGSTVFRLIDIPGAQYQTGYASTCPGSFKVLGEPGNWYGSTIKTCFAEVEPTGVPIYEVTKFTQSVPFLNAFNLPAEIRRALYDDRDLPADSYSKLHIVLELAQQQLPSGSYSGVYFPSRRDEGAGVLTYNPRQVPIEFTYTGMSPPPPELFR